MDIWELPTPAVLVDVNRLMRNIERASKEARENGKEIWPMVKTHKSSYIASLQKKFGAKGFLCGTLDELEILANKNISKRIMLAYPVADNQNFDRLARIIEKGVEIIVRLDNVDNARFLDENARERGIELSYVLKINTGLNRLGVSPSNALKFLKKVGKYKSLNFIGISTHPGHVYGVAGSREVEKVAKETSQIMGRVARELENNGYTLEIVGTGSTPTLRYDLREEIYTHIFPGNYVFYDRLQVFVYESATLEDCALTVLATIISIPEHSNGNMAVINVGSKILGLDKGAHGKSAVEGYGYIIEYPEAVVSSLSEEVGKALFNSSDRAKVGEKIKIIPNHSCVVCNNTSFIVLHEDERVRGVVRVDMRNGVRNIFKAIPMVDSEM